MSQFGDCTDSDPYTTLTFQEALLHIKEQMLSIKGRMWDHILHNYTYFSEGWGERRPIEEVTAILEQDKIYIMFGSSHHNCEGWSFEVKKID